MSVATLTLLSAATARLGCNVFELPRFPGTLIGRTRPLVPAEVAMGHDQWTRGRVPPGLLEGRRRAASGSSLAFLRPTDAWTDFAARIAAVLESVLLPLM